MEELTRWVDLKNQNLRGESQSRDPVSSPQIPPPDIPVQEGEEAERIANTHLVIDNSGSLVETYDKAHLFDVDIPGKVKLKVTNDVLVGFFWMCEDFWMGEDWPRPNQFTDLSINQIIFKILTKINYRTVFS